jgi:hypothetical protein
MRTTALVQRSLSFVDRLVIAFVELTLAAAVIIGSIVVGHELREWREYYPTAYHPWLQTPAPATEVKEP